MLVGKRDCSILLFENPCIFEEADVITTGYLQPNSTLTENLRDLNVHLTQSQIWKLEQSREGLLPLYFQQLNFQEWVRLDNHSKVSV